jgi:exonuclease SbcD
LVAPKLTFIHTADLHIDVPFGLRYADDLFLEKRRLERKKKLERIVDRALEEQAHLLFVAGDLFEHAHVRRSSILFIMEQLNRLKTTRVFISPGNHDPMLPDSYYRTMSWPSHVHIFKDQWESVTIEEWDVVIHGWGFTQYEVEEPIVRQLGIDPSDGRKHIAVVHGTVMDKLFGEHSPYLPITLDDMVRSGVSYFALGHIHKQQWMTNPAGECIGAYPGTPEGSRFSETGEKGIIIGEWGDHLQVSFVPMDGCRYIQLEAGLQGCETEEQILQRVLDELGRVGPKDHHYQHLYRIRCLGSIQPELLLQPRTLQDSLKKMGYEYVEICDETIPDYDLVHLSKQPDVVGDFVREMIARNEQAAGDGDERLMRIVQKSMRYGLDALLSGSVNRR